MKMLHHFESGAWTSIDFGIQGDPTTNSLQVPRNTLCANCIGDLSRKIQWGQESSTYCFLFYQSTINQDDTDIQRKLDNGAGGVVLGQGLSLLEIPE